MEYMGRAPNDLIQYHNEAQALLSDTNTTYHDVAALLEKYQIYSTATIEKWKELEAYLDTVSTVASYNARIDSFVNEVNEDPNIPAIEKIMLKTYGAVVKLDESVSLRGECWECIKKKRRKIFGWRLIFLWATIAWCLLAFFDNTGTALAGCVTLIYANMKAICAYCGKYCWVCNYN